MQLDLQMAQAILNAFGGEDALVTVERGDGHSGPGVYLWFDGVEDEGSVFIGNVGPDHAAFANEGPDAP